ncbi:MAG: TerB family tellurite resistance protein [Deltaproteobacteria bacterium]|nr:TerB family tellurite resistance protein [Deltaproteobacteria bacterium]
MEKKEKLAICKVVCQAILIDGFLTDKERAYLDGVMDKYQLDPDDKKEVMRRNIDDDVTELASDIESDEAKKLVIIEMARAISSDGDLAKSERRLITKVSKKLGFNQEQFENILSEENIISR